MDRIKVMHIVGSAGFGGAERYILSLTNSLDRSKFKMAVVCPYKGELVDKLEQMDVRTYILDMQCWRAFHVFLRLAEIMRKERVQIIHSHGRRSDLYAGISARLAKVPFHVSTVHSSMSFLTSGNLKHLVYQPLYWLLTFIPDRILCVSRFLAEELAKGLSVSTSNISTMYSGVDIDRFDPARYNGSLRAQFGLEKGTPLIGVIARMTEEKGHLYLVEAMREVIRISPNARCVLVGDGYLRPQIEELANHLGIYDHCIFTGPRDDIPEILSSIDLIVLPSLSEAISISLMEAMAMAKPVVATRVGGVPELVKDGVTGALVPPGDSSALRDSILTILAHPSMARGMGLRGRQMIMREFTQDRMVRRIEELYESLVDGQG